MAKISNQLAVSKPKNPSFQSGEPRAAVDVKYDFSTFTSADGDVLVLAEVSLGDRVSGIYANTSAGLPALTAATDNDLGFYRLNGEGDLIAIDADALWDGVTLASANTSTGNLLTGKNAALDESLNVAEHLGVGYDADYGTIFLCLTTNTATSATPVLRLKVEIDKATTS